MPSSPNNLIEVTVKTGFVPQQSKPSDGRYVFFYTITKHNNSDIA